MILVISAICGTPVSSLWVDGHHPKIDRVQIAAVGVSYVWDPYGQQDDHGEND